MWKRGLFRCFLRGRRRFGSFSVFGFGRDAEFLVQIGRKRLICMQGFTDVFAVDEELRRRVYAILIGEVRRAADLADHVFVLDAGAYLISRQTVAFANLDEFVQSAAGTGRLQNFVLVGEDVV